MPVPLSLEEREILQPVKQSGGNIAYEYGVSGAFDLLGFQSKHGSACSAADNDVPN
jgi:hypothetical protein